MEIPSKFKIGGQEFKVEIVPILLDSETDEEIYGCFNYTPPLIKLAKTVYGEEVPKNQMVSTFRHELIHCFQYMFEAETDERLAQVFAGFLDEYEQSAE